MKQHDFAFVPDDRPPRLIRFIWNAKFPDGAVSLYDEENNLLLIDRRKYDELTYEQREEVLRTHEAALYA